MLDNNKYDEFTAKYLKIFIDKRKSIDLPFLKLMRKEVKDFINENIKYSIEEYTIPLTKIKKLVDTHWVDHKVLNNLDTLNANYKISWTFNKINHNIYIKCTKDKFDSFKNRLNILINCLNFVHTKKQIKESRPISMYLILTPLKKFTPLDVASVAPENINSGYTDFLTNEIVIWREEEFEKVIFHEMIHYMDLDVRNMAFTDNELPHEIDGPKSYYEAFTDVWGNFYYFIYLSILTGKSVNTLFEIEYQFIKNQANYFNNLFNLKNWDYKKTIKQETPAFTYFILKFLLFNKIIESKSLDILKNPREVLIKIFKDGFNQETFIDFKSSRMTLIQLF